MAGLGGRPWGEWIARYDRSHQHPVNRLCQFLLVGLRWWAAKVRGRA